MGIEGNRCEAVHEAINKFVVYEKFAEMTHKYDVQQFGKLLEDYDSVEELAVIRQNLGLETTNKSPILDSSVNESQMVAEEH